MEAPATDIPARPIPATLYPVCGYDLGFEAWRGDSASHRLCPSCGIEFGYDDVEGGGHLKGTREEIHQY